MVYLLFLWLIWQCNDDCFDKIYYGDQMIFEILTPLGGNTSSRSSLFLTKSFEKTRIKLYPGETMFSGCLEWCSSIRYPLACTALGYWKSTFDRIWWKSFWYSEVKGLLGCSRSLLLRTLVLWSPSLHYWSWFWFVPGCIAVHVMWRPFLRNRDKAFCKVRNWRRHYWKLRYWLLSKGSLCGSRFQYRWCNGRVWDGDNGEKCQGNWFIV